MQSTSTPLVRSDLQQTGSDSVQRSDETTHSVHLPSPITVAAVTDTNTTSAPSTGAADR